MVALVGMAAWLAISCFQYFILDFSCGQHATISKIFQNPEDQSIQPFQHMVVEWFGGRVYIGGVNRLYQLTPELDIEARVETGPFEEDSVKCHSCDAKRNLKPNYNKALTVYANQSKLIVCGSYQGSCRLHNLHNISEIDPPVVETVVANDQASTSVIFVAPGPPDFEDTLYVATTYPVKGNDELPAVATRSLRPGSLFKVAYRTVNTETQMFVENTLRKEYRIEYVYGFSSGVYSYFVTRQPQDNAFESPYHSKLARLCHGDQNYYSYMEVQLECVYKNEEFNLVQSVYLGKPGFYLARDLNVSVDDDVLYAVFANAMDRSPASPARQSALCVYSIKQIEEKFLDNIRLCANGSMLRGLSFFKQEKPCAKTSYGLDYLSCGYEVNYPLGGKIPIQRQAGYKTNSVRLTAVVATITKKYTVVFMGTDDGNLKKAVVKRSHEVFEYAMVAVDSGRPILADLQFDISGEYIYVMTAASVSKIKMFNDCSTYKSCQDCLSDYPCDWCPETVTCSSNVEDSCRNQRIINGLTRLGPSIRKSPSFCPHILPVDNSPIVYVPSGTTKALSVRVMNLLDFQTSFICQFEISSTMHKTPGKRVESRIECDPVNFTYSNMTPNDTATFSVAWDEGKTLYNRENIRVLMYKCEHLATNCGFCLYLDSQFACGWCNGTQSCSTEDQCKNGSWMDKSVTCPGPKIRNFYPQSGPLDGGTNVTIEGINLGRFFHDIENAVLINNVPCIPIVTEYRPPTRIVCTTGPANHREVQSGPIMVKLNDDYIALSNPEFNYVDPRITGFSPTKGPKSGGTIITIMGENLNVGSSVKATMAGVPCEVTLREKDRAYCRTGASSLITTGDLVMNFDAATRTYVDKQYSYLCDPSILTVKPQRSTVTGGIRMRVDGERFQLIQSARMYFFYMGQEFTSQCDVIRNISTDGPFEATDIQRVGLNTSTYIRCWTPKILISTSDRMYPSRNRPLLVDYGLVLDGVKFRNGGGQDNENKISIYPDPTFLLFGKNGGRRMKFFRELFLSLEGENLDLVVEKEDVEVYIGDKPCMVMNLTINELICKPPTEQPTRPLSASLVDRYSSDGLPEVSVRIGGANYTLGYLSYDEPIVSTSGGLPTEMIAIAAFAAVTLSILLAVSVWWCMKRRSIKSALKRLERELASYQEVTQPDTTRSLNDQVDILSYNKAYEIDRNLVTLTSKLLGAGQFGKIVQGEQKTTNGKSMIQVAVKMVKDATDFHSTRALADELKVMSHIRPHVNVLCLVGACTRHLEHHGLLVLTEFCENGSLRDYLIRNASIFNDIYANAIDQGPIEKLLNYAFQAANGMVHLSASNVIHRDLALRNLLLTAKHIVKISDFGLSRQHIDTYQMSLTSNTPLPIHWMALESLSTGLFTNKSDVWSFGIVLWEIFNCGKLPYTRHAGDPAVFRDWLHESDDNRLGPPSMACDEMYHLMRRCWQKNPKDRPTFSECKWDISQFLRQRSPNSYHLLELLISDGWMTVAEFHGNQAPSQLENAPETERLLTPPGHQGSDSIEMEVFDFNAEVDANGYQLPSSRKRMEAGNPQYGNP